MTDTTTTSPYISVVEALLPEARRLKAMARERFEQAFDNGDWGAANIGANAINEMAVSIIGMLVLAAGEGEFEAIKDFEVPSIDGDLRPASYHVVERMLVLTEDGGPADFTHWHKGPSDLVEVVRYERWNDRRERLGHGYVHPTTRQLVQSG